MVFTTAKLKFSHWVAAESNVETVFFEKSYFKFLPRKDNNYNFVTNHHDLLGYSPLASRDKSNNKCSFPKNQFQACILYCGQQQF